MTRKLVAVALLVLLLSSCTQSSPLSAISSGEKSQVSESVPSVVIAESSSQLVSSKWQPEVLPENPVRYDSTLLTDGSLAPEPTRVSIGEEYLDWRLTHFEEQHEDDAAIANFIGNHIVKGVLSIEDVYPIGLSVWFTPYDVELFPRSPKSTTDAVHVVLDWEKDYSDLSKLKLSKPTTVPYIDAVTAFEKILEDSAGDITKVMGSNYERIWWCNAVCKLDNPSIEAENFDVVKESFYGTIAVIENKYDGRATAYLFQPSFGSEQGNTYLCSLRVDYEAQVDYQYYEIDAFLDALGDAQTWESFVCELELSTYRSMGVPKGSANAASVKRIISAEKMDTPQLIWD